MPGNPLSSLMEWLRSDTARKAASIGLPSLVSRLSRALWGVAMVFAIRVLPETSYAELAVGRSLMMLALAFGSVFAARTQLKFAAEGQSPREIRLANGSIYLSVGFSVLMVAALCICAELIDQFYGELELASLIRLCGVAAFARSLLGIPNAAMLAKYRTLSVMIVDLVSVVLAASLMGYLVLAGRLVSAHQVIATLILAESTAFGVSCFLVRDEIRLALGTDAGSLKKVLSFSFYSLGSTLVFRVYSRVDILMLGKLADPAQVAAYGACRALTEFLINIHRAGNQILLPLVSRMWRQGRIRPVMKRVLQGAGILTAIILPGAVVMMLFPGWVLDVAYKGKYAYGAAILAILSSLAFFRPLLNAFSISCSAAGKPSISFQTVLASSVVNLTLNAALIPSMGGVGAAIATAVAIVTGLAFVSFRFTRLWRNSLETGVVIN